MTISKSPLSKSLSLTKKLTILFCSIFIIGMIISGTFITFMINENAQQEICSKALILMETMNSVRDYTNTRIKPQLINKDSAEFIPETVPAFSARIVFETIRNNPLYQDFLYREATLNPTNIIDKSNADESAIIQHFRSDSQLKEKTGFLTSNNQSEGDFFYVARPLVVSQRSCLQCHGSPAKAPKNMIDKYGSENGFNWQLREIVGAQIVYVPVKKIFSSAHQLFFSIILITFMFSGITISVIYHWLQKQVVRPIVRIANTVEDISMGGLDKKLDSKRQDEIGLLSRSIDRMGMSLQMAMQRISNQKNQKK